MTALAALIGAEWSPFALAVAMLAGLLIGLGKGGLAGMGTVSTPLLAIVVGPVLAAGVLLPVLISQDIVSVWAFRRDWDRRTVALMLPGAVAGVLTGWAAAEYLPTLSIMAALGLVSVAFAGWRLSAQWWPATSPHRQLPDGLAPLFGYATGLTSQIAHAGAPPFQIWAVHRRMAPAMFAGTGAVLFAVINWIKVPAYVALGELDTANLTVAAMLIPVATIGSFAGIFIVRRIDMKRFSLLVNVLLLLTGVKLIYDALV